MNTRIKFKILLHSFLCTNIKTFSQNVINKYYTTIQVYNETTTQSQLISYIHITNVIGNKGRVCSYKKVIKSVYLRCYWNLKLKESCQKGL
jgi:hypothetical protein